MKDEKYYLYHGGYLKCGDKLAKDGDLVRFKLTCTRDWIYGKLYYNDTDGCFLVQDFKQEDNPYYLWEVVAWELHDSRLWIIDCSQTKGEYYISIEPDEAFIDEDIYSAIGISEERFYQIARKNNASCHYHVIEYDFAKKDAYDTYFTCYKDIENFRKNLEEAMNE